MTDDAFDLSAYLVRIGYSGPREPSLATLRALVAAHTAAIPFENIDVFLRCGVRIDVPSVQRKLVAEKRGGYCFEQSTLFEAALAALGFAPIPLIARVMRGVPEGITTPRSHKLLLVNLTEVPFLADVGFGNLSPTAPIALRSDEEQPTSHETYRLVRAGPEFVMQAGLGGRWESMYRFALEPAPHIDYEVGNWFTSTYPGSPFYGNLIVALARPGDRITLYNRRLTVRDPVGRTSRRVLSGIDDYGSALRGEFGLALDDNTLAAIADAMATRSGDEEVHRAFL